MSTFAAILLGIALGLAMGCGVWALMRLVGRGESCRHDRVKAHSTEQYVNTSYLWVVCLDCGKPIKFELGFTARAKGAQMKAASAAMEARGYVLTPGSGIDGNTFERKV